MRPEPVEGAALSLSKGRASTGAVLSLLKGSARIGVRDPDAQDSGLSTEVHSAQSPCEA
jgi:hypothetical protein